MARFRKKPVEVEAVQFTGDNADEIGHFAGITARVAGRDRHLEIKTLEGIMTARPGDWIIRGVKGEFYPCKPDIFEQTYEPAGYEVVGEAVHVADGVEHPVSQCRPEACGLEPAEQVREEN